MSKIPVITGIGAVTPLGPTADQTWGALLGGASISRHVSLKFDHPIPAETDPQIAHVLIRSNDTRLAGLSRVSALAHVAADEAISQAGWDTADRSLAIIGCSSKGAVYEWLDGTARRSDNIPSAGGFGISSLTRDLGRSLGLADGPRLCVSAACAGGVQAVIRGCIMLAAGEARRVLVVAAEASVHPLFVASFSRLGVIAPPGELCRPFDVRRSGFLMSDAAAAVCLELGSVEDHRSLVSVDAYALGGDAAHLAGGDTGGHVLRRLLRAAKGHQSIDLIHAHGTGTLLNDATEAAAYDEVFADSAARVPLFSHKGAIGHTLGAAGLLATVLSTLCHQHQCVPPNTNSNHLETLSKLLVSDCKLARPIRRSILQAAGFGGGIAILRLGSHPKA